MKKVMFCLAIASMFTFAACSCGGNKPAEETTECTAPETEIVDEAVPTDEIIEDATEAIENAAENATENATENVQ